MMLLLSTFTGTGKGNSDDRERIYNTVEILNDEYWTAVLYGAVDDDFGQLGNIKTEKR